MAPIRRVSHVLAFAATALLMLTALPISAQDDAIPVTGSAVVGIAAQALADANGTPIALEAAGTTRGFETLCSAAAPLTLSTRPISVEEEASCIQQNVSFLELVIGYEAIVFVTGNQTAANLCLDNSQLNQMLGPSAAGQITDWTQVDDANASEPLTVLLPEPETSGYALLDQIVPGDGLRADAASIADGALSDQVNAAPGIISAASYADAIAAGEDVRVFELNATAAGCTAPSAEAFAARTYGAANPLLLYANAESATTNASLADFLTFSTSAAAAETMTAAGFVAPPASVVERNQSILADSRTGRQFTRYVTEFTIPPTVAGAITVAGAASGQEAISRLATAFTTAYPGVTSTVSTLGEADGVRRLCNGEVDMIITNDPLTDEQQANCAAVNVVPVTIPIGWTAAALLHNAETPYLECLTLDQLAAATTVSGNPVPEAWDEVDAGFGADPILILAPPTGSYVADLLAVTAGGPNALPRNDHAVQHNSDPAYRAAATANVTGAVSLFTMSELTEVLESDQANVAPLQVDGGSGCVSPSNATVADGSYVIARPINLVVSQSALARQEVQSFLWFVAGDDQFDVLVNNGIAGIAFEGLQTIRDGLQDAFAEANAAASTPQPEATPEATAEVTPEVSPEATVEATASS